MKCKQCSSCKYVVIIFARYKLIKTIKFIIFPTSDKIWALWDTFQKSYDFSKSGAYFSWKCNVPETMPRLSGIVGNMVWNSDLLMQSTLTHNIDDILLLFEHCGALFSRVMTFWNRAPGAYYSWRKKMNPKPWYDSYIVERWYETLICCSKAHSNTMLTLLSNHLSTGGLLLP